MTQRFERQWRRPITLAGCLLLLLLTGRRLSLAQETVCAVVKLELNQEATLEREGFDAHLALNNGSATALQDLFVNVSISDSNGAPADGLFFIKVNSVVGTSAVDGTGVVQSSSIADIHWLIIPSTGAGGTSPLGKTYSVTADISFTNAGVAQVVKTLPATIVVKPQPALKLEYVLPFEVFADQPLTTEIEPAEPFALGVRVTNVGFGTARNFTIDSAQPQIVEDKQGLLVGFKLLGTVVAGKTIPNTMLVPFGDIPAGGTALAEWTMTTSLSGRFNQLSSTFTHAAELGGQLTSLIQQVTTYTLLKDVLVDVPGRDATPDFLVNVSQPRGDALQALLDAGGALSADLLLESDQAQAIPVVEVPGALSGQLNGRDSQLILKLTNSAPANAWVHTSVPFPLGASASLLSARRSDGKIISSKNAWISKHFRKSDKTTLYRLNLLDFSPPSTSYVLQFNAPTLDQAPGAVTDLAAATGLDGGRLQLSWTAPGEDGYTGDILGGSYLIETEEDPNATFSPASAQMVRSTTSSPGDRESLLAAGLAGNTTFFIRLWTRDAGGNVSQISNAATSYALPNPPSNLVFASISSDVLAAHWQPGNNRAPAVTSLSLAASGGVFVSSTPSFDDSTRAFSFRELSPNTSYFASGVGRNPLTGASSLPAAFGVVVTSAAVPVPAAFSDVGTSSVNARWLAGGNPADTEFLVEFSTDPGRAPVLASSGWVRAASFIFSGLAPATSYYGQVKARNRALVETAYADLGAIRTAPVDTLPPRTSLLVGAPSFGASPVFVTSATGLNFAAVDDKLTLGDGLGVGVDKTFFALDAGSFTVYGGTFSLVSEGTHTVSFFSVDLVGNAELARSSAVAVDLTPPLTLFQVFGASVGAGGGFFIASGTAVGFAALDPTSGGVNSGVAFTEYRVDSSSGGAFQRFNSPFILAEGAQRIEFRARDNVGNLELLKPATAFVDATAPVSSLAIGAPQFSLSSTTLLVSSRTPFSIAAADPVSNGVASGVKDSFYRISDISSSSAPFTIFTTSFTLATPDILKVIEFHSRDNVLNAEPTRSSTLLLDSTPPEVALLSPAACDSGICRVIKGRFPVLGTSRDAHFAGFALNFAPGRDATTGYVLISSGAVAVSSASLGIWDTGALSGWLTLRLSAADLVQNASSLSINVFVGDPGTLMVLGNHGVFNMPEGVAVGADGTIYVADRDNDRIAVFSSTGTPLASFGTREDDKEVKRSSAALRLNKPSGVAVDAVGNVFVADTNHNRVLKLSATGQLLLELGRREKGEPKPGKAPGEFNKPSGVAVDALGRLYISDTQNRRVQVFTSTGGFALKFDLPVIPQGKDDDDKDEDDAATRGKPAGIALDGAGNIYVADPKGGRALKFSPDGTLTLAIPIAGEKPDEAGRPMGIAVSHSGGCLLVSDQKSGRILKFDFEGNQNLVFGAKQKQAKKLAGVGLRKPTGLAMDATGALYVADRNDSRIKKFSLPDGEPTLLTPPGRDDGELAQEVVERDEGGTVERRDRAAVLIPPLAVEDDLKVSVSTPTVAMAAESRKGAEDKSLKVASPPVEYGPHGTQFEKPVTLTIPYNPELVLAQRGSEDSLRVHYWNEEKKEWEDLESAVDKKNRTVSAKTRHFSLYQVFAGSGTAPAASPLAADPSFGLKASYAFPNPVRGTAVVTIRIQPGIADSVEVRVYDVAGRKVHSSSDFRTLGAFDDGNGLGPQFTYDHVWNVSGIGSGVYTYVVTARKAGEKDIHKTGRIGVVR